MRVTQQHRVDAAIRSLRQNRQTLEELRLQVATGRRILQPSDDPLGAQRSINLRSYLNATQGSLRNIEFTDDWMSATASSLRAFGDVLTSMGLRGLQAANDTMSAKERQAIAVEVREALNHALDIANTDHQGQRLFAGFKVTADPFTLIDPATLKVKNDSDFGVIRHLVEPGTEIVVNVNGKEPLFDAGFAALGDLYGALNDNDAAAIRAAVSGLKEAHEMATEKAAAMGARISALDSSRTRLQKLEVDLEGLLTQIEGVDVPEASVKMSASQQQYDATLITLARDTFKSLFDYLG